MSSLMTVSIGSFIVSNYSCVLPTQLSIAEDWLIALTVLPSFLASLPLDLFPAGARNPVFVVLCFFLFGKVADLSRSPSRFWHLSFHSSLSPLPPSSSGLYKWPIGYKYCSSQLSSLIHFFMEDSVKPIIITKQLSYLILVLGKRN